MEETLKFFDKLEKMCASYAKNDCEGCPFFDKTCITINGLFGEFSTEKIVTLVENWDAENPQ